MAKHVNVRNEQKFSVPIFLNGMWLRQIIRCHATTIHLEKWAEIASSNRAIQNSQYMQRTYLLRQITCDY